MAYIDREEFHRLLKLLEKKKGKVIDDWDKNDIQDLRKAMDIRLLNNCEDGVREKILKRHKERTDDGK